MKIKKRTLFILLALVCVIFLACILLLLFKKELKFELNGKSNIAIEVKKDYKDEKANACYGNIFSCKKIKYTTTGKVDTKKTGTYKLTYKASYKNKSKTLTRTVKVVDKTKPELTVKDSDNLTVCPNGKLKNYEYSAEDNLDGDLKEKVDVKISLDKLVFSVKDSNNNVTTKSFDYKKEDKENPTISLNGDAQKYILVGETFKDEGATASDNCDEVQDKIKVNGSVDTSKPGTYKLTYEIADETGNKASVERKVIVYNKNVDVDPSSKTVYLTFDDGPGPHTARLLDVLKKYNVKATFFVTNQYPAYEDMITRAHNEGHAIAIHTYTHNYSYVYSSVDNYFADLQNMQDKIKRLTGEETKLVRFPGGGSNTVSRNYCSGIMSTLANELEVRGYKYFDWNVASGDAGETKSTSQIISNVTSHLRSSYTIVLQHDVKGYSVDAVESIIQYGLANGYHFAPLDITSPTAHQRINN